MAKAPWRGPCSGSLAQEVPAHSWLGHTAPHRGADATRLPKDPRKGNDTFLHYSQILDSDEMKTKARRRQACRPKSNGLTLPFLEVKKWAWSVRAEPQDSGDRGHWPRLTLRVLSTETATVL